MICTHTHTLHILSLFIFLSIHMIYLIQQIAQNVSPRSFLLSTFSISLCTRTVQSGFVPHVTFLVQKTSGRNGKMWKGENSGATRFLQSAVYYPSLFLSLTKTSSPSGKSYTYTHTHTLHILSLFSFSLSLHIYIIFTHTHTTYTISLPLGTSCLHRDIRPQLA
jgi:hypothetical protein